MIRGPDRASVPRVEPLRPAQIDVGVAVLLAVVGAGEFLAAGYERSLVGVAGFLVATAGVAFARRFPLLVSPWIACVYALTALVGFDVSEPPAWIPLLGFAFFATGVYARPERWPLGLVSVAAAFAVMYAALARLTDFDPSLLFGLALTLGPWGLGLALRRALERERQLGAAAERARLEVAFARERAVRRERERVAAELHDVLAHALGAMVVQTSAARDVVRAGADDAARTLTGVAEAGRDALAETAALVRALREGHPSESEAAMGVEGQRPVRWRDALLPATFGVVATAEILSNDYGAITVGLSAYWLTCLALVTRRALPLATPLAVTAILVGSGLVGFDSYEAAASIPVSGLAYFAAGRHSARLAWGFAAVVASAASIIATEGLSPDALLLLVFVFAPWGIGVALRTSLARARGHAVEAERARLEAAAEAERATAAERRRIARELHDLLASSLSVMVVQASLACELVRADPGRAEAAVAEVERAGRAALERTGSFQRLIREGVVGTHPQHGTADLPGLVAEYERAGLAVELEGAELERVPAGVDASVYRIVQEALTNALKHAPGSHVRIRLTRSASGVEVEVVNSAPADERRARVPSGHGLTGLRERVGLYGGWLDARPTADGGFLLAASMPVMGER